jgi:antirestriction protein ArdC
MPRKNSWQLGGAFLCADLELTLRPREDHPAYIAYWLTALQNDTRATFGKRLMRREPSIIHGLQA